jgi:fibronectin type 3 domain-containing protein
MYKIIVSGTVLLILALILHCGCKKEDETAAPETSPDLQDSISAVDSTKKSPKVRLIWSPNTEPDLLGYRIYRRYRPLLTDSSMPWTSWVVLVEKIGAAETVHVDALVELDHEYEYKVTAFDSMGNESGFSNMTHAHVR